MTPIRVAIVDDHPALREGVAAILEREPDLRIVALAGSLADARPLLTGPDAPDVIVLDIRLGGDRGLELLADRPPGATRPAIVVWTAWDLPQYATWSARAGAAGFVLKTAPTAELVTAIRRVVDGGVHFALRPDPGHRDLTVREREVAAALVEGLSNDEIGARLGVSTRAVEAHLTRLYERFGVQSRTELARRLDRDGWLDLQIGRAHV